MKRVLIEASFPELSSGRMYATGKGEASCLKPAISRAVAAVLKNPAIRGKRIHSIKMIVSITDVDAAHGGGKDGVSAGLVCAECGGQLALNGDCYPCLRRK